MSDVRKHIVFYGRVQGVGFRYTAKYLAQSLELTGWVRNEYDGTVTMEVQGREARINKLLVGLNQNRFITIDWGDTTEIPLEEEPSSRVRCHQADGIQNNYKNKGETKDHETWIYRNRKYGGSHHGRYYKGRTDQSG